mgnify:CR=1 FL=1
MPEVTIGGKTKHYSYSKAGYKAAARARKKKPSKRNYSKEAIMMAKRGVA